MSRYRQIDASEVPLNVIFDVPRQNQGQTVEVAYGDVVAKPGPRGEFGVGDRYKRVTDQSESVDSPERTRYFKRK